MGSQVRQLIHNSTETQSEIYALFVEIGGAGSSAVLEHQPCHELTTPPSLR